jgi:hypothetical protein
MQLVKEEPYIGDVKGLNLAAMRHMTLQVANCNFRMVKYSKAQPSDQACTDRDILYIM